MRDIVRGERSDEHIESQVPQFSGSEYQAALALELERIDVWGVIVQSHPIESIDIDASLNHFNAFDHHNRGLNLSRDVIEFNNVNNHLYFDSDEDCNFREASLQERSIASREKRWRIIDTMYRIL